MITKHCLSGLLATVVATGAAEAATATDRSVVTDPDLRAFLPSFEAGTERFMNGDAGLWKSNVSHRDDTMIMGAWGAYEKGWPEVSARYDWAVKRFEPSGAKLSVEYLSAVKSGDLAVTTAIERATVKLAGVDAPAPMTLRVTHVFRQEGEGWKLVLRHADALTAKIPTDAVLE